MGRPSIGIPVPLALERADRGSAGDGLCAAALSRAGGLPVLLPVEGDRAAAGDLIKRLDGLLLAGGRPLSAGFLAEHPRPSLEETDPERYRFEHALVLAAAEQGVPMLGICRGMQTINEALGGTLVRNLALDWPGALGHRMMDPEEHRAHRIRIAPHSHLSVVVGEDHVLVNSRHLQAVETPGAGLVAAAWADDGVIEAVEASGDDPFIVGVQFHPEALIQHDGRWLGLFAMLVTAASRRLPLARAGKVWFTPM
ncbi:MAG: gamma-glutamyl-gamma-aminobutyrate hydrolase family protein [Armatimonadetes bacterium]|nr:gamma-glutamyl-gamma-aminobutyrate hydrolase family protein [Armatimonadota bacterium]